MALVTVIYIWFASTRPRLKMAQSKRTSPIDFEKVWIPFGKERLRLQAHS